MAVVQTSSSEPQARRGAPTPPSSNAFTRRQIMRRRRARRRAAGVVTLALVMGTVVVVLATAGSDPSPSKRTPSSTTKPVSTTTLSPTTVQLGTERALPFSPTSFWNTPLAADAPLSPDSDTLVSAFNKQWRTFYGTVGINTDDYSIPVYTVPTDQPTVSVSLAPDCHSDPGLQQQFKAVPIPSNAQPANGGDHTLVIWQPATDTEWELWVARQDAGGAWSACWGGRIQNVSKAQGVFPDPYGVAASGLSYLAGSMKVSELQAGEIKHALAVNVVHTTAGTQVPPATRNDGNSSAPDAIPEGTRFRLDPSIDVTKLGLSPTGVTIARALQTYGMLVTDTSGAVVVVAEDGQPYVTAGQPNPYVAIFGDQESYQVLAQIPWDRLQVVQSGA
jgi:hypothetical protein